LSGRQRSWLGPGIVLLALAAACSAFNPNVGPLIDAAPPSPSCTLDQGSGEYGGYGDTPEDAGSASCGDGS